VRRDEVDVALSQLTNSTFRSLDDAAATLAYRLTVDLAADKSVVVLPFTFQQSDFASPFSRHFDQILRLELTIAGIDVFDPNVGAPQDLTGDQHGTDYVISGSYVPQASGVTVFGYATDLATGRKVGAAELLIDTVAIADHASLRPQNFEAAMSDMGIFATGELIPGTLQIEAWTSRGDRNLILAEDDEITLAIRGSEPCYLQIVYHLADGRRALLYNNYYIDHGRANHVVVLPDTFIVAEPLGVEVLQVFASNERFAEVNVSPWEGYDLLAEDLDEFVSRTRGLKKKKKERKVAEARLTVTTMKSQ
jgi:hypothetical protein